MPNGQKTRVGLCFAALCAPVLAGCAVSYDDAQGNRHVVGLVDVTIATPKDDRTLAGNVVSVAAVGVLVTQNQQGSTVALGYASETTAAIKDNALVLGNPVRAIHTVIEGEPK